jgi:hypothetical protein
LPDTHPFKHVDVMPEKRISFVGETRSDNFFDAGLSRCCCHQLRIDAIAGDDSEKFWNLHRAHLLV